MSPKRLLAGALIASFHFSTCTGGILSASLALASEFAPSETHISLMSPVPTERSCNAFSPVTEKNVSKNGRSNGCKDSRSCITQSQNAGFERSMMSSVAAGILALASIPVRELSVLFLMLFLAFVLARAGPVLALAPLRARTIAKRE